MMIIMIAANVFIGLVELKQEVHVCSAIINLILHKHFTDSLTKSKTYLRNFLNSTDKRTNYTKMLHVQISETPRY
jgi:hypothetical protein